MICAQMLSVFMSVENPFDIHNSNNCENEFKSKFIGPNIPRTGFVFDNVVKQ